MIADLGQAYAPPDIDVWFLGKPPAPPRRRLGVVLASDPRSDATGAQAALDRARQVAATLTLRDA